MFCTDKAPIVAIYPVSIFFVAIIDVSEYLRYSLRLLESYVCVRVSDPKW
jgi:hypothetical protein